MIGKIKGIVEYIDESSAIIDVSGVGYVVHCSSRALSQLNVGGKVEFFIETHVREDRISLFGFLSVQEKECFLKLLTVKGVGPKMGLQILGALVPQQIYSAIALKDNAVFSQISGVGPKLVSRIFAELKDLGKNIDVSQSMSGVISVEGVSSGIKDDAISALINLGMNRMDASNSVVNILKDNPDIDLNKLIKLSLNAKTR